MIGIDTSGAMLLVPATRPLNEGLPLFVGAYIPAERAENIPAADLESLQEAFGGSLEICRGCVGKEMCIYLSCPWCTTLEDIEEPADDLQLGIRRLLGVQTIRRHLGYATAAEKLLHAVH